MIGDSLDVTVEVFKDNDNRLALVVLDDYSNTTSFAQVYEPVWFTYGNHFTMLHFVEDFAAVNYEQGRGYKRVWDEWDGLPLSGEELEKIRETWELVYKG